MASFAWNATPSAVLTPDTTPAFSALTAYPFAQVGMLASSQKPVICTSSSLTSIAASAIATNSPRESVRSGSKK